MKNSQKQSGSDDQSTPKRSRYDQRVIYDYLLNKIIIYHLKIHSRCNFLKDKCAH